MFNRFRKSVSLILKLFGFARPYWLLIILTICSMAAYAGFSYGRLLLVKPVVNKGIDLKLPGFKESPKAEKPIPFEDAILGENPKRYLINLAIVAALLTLLVAMADYLKEFIRKYVSLRVTVDIRNHVCSHIVNLSIRFFNQKKAGDLISRLTNDTVSTQSALEFIFGDIILQPLSIMVIFCYMIYLDWQLTLFLMIFLPIYVWIFAKLGKRIKRYKKKSLVKLGDVTESMHQMFSGIRTVKSFKMEEAEIKDFQKENMGFFRKAMGVVRTKAFASSALELINGSAFLVMLVVGIYFVKAGHIDFGTASTFFAFLIGANRPVRLLAKSYNTLQEALAGAERVFELTDLRPEVKDEPGARELAEVKRGIKFNDVSFAYEQEMVLQNINLDAKCGETIALVGPTGAGKSTILDLIARFYDPQQGSIIIDGMDIKRLKTTSLISHLAIVGQETFLFNESIRENISYGRPGASREEIIKAAQAAQIHEFIESLPQKYETEVGERGARLSGGERQRIAIARAILKNASILLLDEATAALDTESESLVQAALENLMKGRTTFVIAHRLSTVQHADRIIVLDEGRIVEQGTHDELLKAKGLYARLYHMQFRGQNKTS